MKLLKSIRKALGFGLIENNHPAKEQEPVRSREILITPNKDPGILIIEAAADSNIGNIEKLLKAGVDANSKDENGVTPLMTASLAGNEATAKLLLENEADVNARNIYGETALIKACLKGHLSVVELLIANGADTNIKDCREGNTPLMQACSENRIRIVEVLIKNGADPNCKQEREGITPLMIAAHRGYDEIFKLLIANGADPELRAVNGMTVGDIISSMERWNMSEMLNNRDCPVEKLKNAILNKDIDQVRELIDSGGNVDSIIDDYSKRTALIQAICCDAESLVEYLLIKGANPSLRDYKGRNAYDNAKYWGNRRIIELLENPESRKKQIESEEIDHHSLIQELIEIGKTEKFISCNPSKPEKYDDKSNHIRTREIGELLDKSGGMQLMREAHERVLNALGALVARELESAWGDIGDWWG